jgi:hypothetical protein
VADTAVLKWEDLPQAMIAAEMDMAKQLFGQRLTDALRLIRLVGENDSPEMSARDAQLAPFGNDPIPVDAFNLCCEAGLIAKTHRSDGDYHCVTMLPKGREMYAQIRRADWRIYLLDLADRFDAGDEPDDELDLLADVALFQPDDNWVACRISPVSRRVVLTTKDGRSVHVEVGEWTNDRPGTAAALRERAARETPHG